MDKIVNDNIGKLTLKSEEAKLTRNDNMAEKEVFIKYQDKLLGYVEEYNRYVDSLEGQRNNLLTGIEKLQAEIDRYKAAYEELKYQCTESIDHNQRDRIQIGLDKSAELLKPFPENRPSEMGR